MIRHTVLFRLNRPLTVDHLEQFMATVRAFAETGPNVIGDAQVEPALGLRGDGPGTADVLLEAVFEEDDLFRAYIESPEHQALIADVVRPACEGWLSQQIPI